MRSFHRFVCLLFAIGPASCQYPVTLRRAHPIRSQDGESQISVERCAQGSTVSWRLVRLSDVYEADGTGDANSLYEAQASLRKNDCPEKWLGEDQPKPVASKKGRPDTADTDTQDNENGSDDGGDNESPGGGEDGAGGEGAEDDAGDEKTITVKVPKDGEYGEVFLLQVVEQEGSNVVRNTVTTHDDRDQALAIGAEVGLLFIPELDSALTSTQVSIFPSRLWAVNRREATDVSWFTDQLSIDAGIVGGAVIGDAPGELGGRTAFSLGLGYLLAKGWAFKAGIILYRDAENDDDLTDSAYWGMSYDLLRGLMEAKN